MKVFVHYKKQQLEGFLNRISALNEQYIARSFEFESLYLSLLEECQEFFQQIGDASNEVEMSRQRVYYETALKGVNPQTLEKLRVGKRENTWIAAFHTLSNVTGSLQQALTKVEQILEETNETLGQVVLSALQSKLLTEADLQLAGDIGRIESVWQMLMQQASLKLVERNIKLRITEHDIYILVDKIFTRIQ
ncbi:hypothetical protein [Tunicatimonas pelagia]|uniref:hypothetical protein n=1 Tax=Tunicatimonas pelagia TaxID=931531 RepID=UPI002666D50B|nr:hypothetical protein [Tunicatimonas pelagia]WKN44618.1 hypothetical protein P0M28_06530 [Tunicatimonas pelagia]